MPHLKSNKRQQGFTLIELLTVMLILVAVAAVTVETTSELAFQGRYEVTKDRYEKIKRAIIGQPNVLINGQPDISGFAADMGRLPDNIRELFQAGYCVSAGGTAPGSLIAKYRPATCTGDWKWSTTKCTNNLETTKTDCTTAGHWWLGQINSSEWRHGWNGPYLAATKDLDANNAFVDGWGTTSDALNYGWNFNNTLPDSNLTLNSYGKDSLSGAGADDYDKDYPGTDFPAITESDWKVDISGIQVNALASNVPPATPCTSIPFETDLVACKMAGGHWDGTCSDTTYTTRYQCEVINGEDWTPVSTPPICNGPTTPSTKYSCEALGGTWNTKDSKTCLKIYYTSINSISGEIGINIPLVSKSIETIPGDGRVHPLHFELFFYDKDDNGKQHSTDDDFLSLVPYGKVSISLHNYDDINFICLDTSSPSHKS